MEPCNRDNVPLKQRQNYPLALKIKVTEERIREWYQFYEGKVYVSFSGGKDSTVLLDIVRRLYPDVVAVFVDTGLEFPEIREFVNTIDNVRILRPKMPFTSVISKYGYPIVSKEQAQFLRQYRESNSEKLKDIRWNGNNYGQGKISEKWKYLVDAPFKISEQCCEVMKKRPFKAFEKESGLAPILGIMAEESSTRTQDYNKTGCNAFNAKRPTSKPLSFWRTVDIWDYIDRYDLPVSKIYEKGYERTGCMFCLFGYHMDSVSRLDLIRETHPEIYRYMMDRLKLNEILEWYPKKPKD